MINKSVYVIRDPRPEHLNVPRYVGKGSRKRAEGHFRINAKHGNPEFTRFMTECRERGLKPGLEFIACEDTHKLEGGLINEYGRLSRGDGTLYNFNRGFPLTARTRRKTRAVRRCRDRKKRGAKIVSVELDNELVKRALGLNPSKIYSRRTLTGGLNKIAKPALIALLRKDGSAWARNKIKKIAHHPAPMVFLD